MVSFNLGQKFYHSEYLKTFEIIKISEERFTLREVGGKMTVTLPREDFHLKVKRGLWQHISRLKGTNIGSNFVGDSPFPGTVILS